MTTYTHTGKKRRFKSSAGEAYQLEQVREHDQFTDCMVWQLEIAGLTFRFEPVDDSFYKWSLSGADAATIQAIAATTRGHGIFPTMRRNMKLLLDLMELVLRQAAPADDGHDPRA